MLIIAKCVSFLFHTDKKGKKSNPTDLKKVNIIFDKY